MERENQQHDLIDLGAASVETRGLVGSKPDLQNGQTGTAALTDD